MLRLLEAWDGLREKTGWRLGGVGFGILVATSIVLGPTPEGLTEGGKRAGAVALVMALWWLGGVLPAALVALVPLVAFPALGVQSTAEVAPGYADPLLFLLLGGFVLGHAMEEVGLHRRLVALLLRPAWVRAQPARVVGALMVAAAIVSGFVSNTGTMVMLLPLSLALAARVSGSARVRSAFSLSLAYACSIGGVATLVGTAPNAVFAGLTAKLPGGPVSFLDWMFIGVPFVVLALPLAWFVVNRVTMRLPDAPDGAIEAPAWPAWNRGERAVLAIIAVCFVAWVTRADVNLGGSTLPGWGKLMPKKIDDGFVAMLAAMACFLIPGRSDEGGFLLSWKKAAKALPWSVLTLLGGGFAMANGISSSGLADWVAQGTVALESIGDVPRTFLICVSVAFLSAFTSNTATTQVVLPLLAAGATAAGVDPLVWMVPATISASCDFTLAVGTPPNAIAAEAGGVRAADMALSGLILNVLCAVVATVVVLATKA